MSDLRASQWPTTDAHQRRVERVLARMKAAGGRATVPTRLVVTILTETDRHLTADDVLAELERRTPGIAPSTVYRVLQRLDELGLLEHVHSGAGPAFYHVIDHGRPDSIHAHLVCSQCGTVLDLDRESDAAMQQFARVVRAAHGFHLEPHHAALLGRCARCATPSHHGGSVNLPAVGDEPFVVRRTAGPVEPTVS